MSLPVFSSYVYVADSSIYNMYIAYYHTAYLKIPCMGALIFQGFLFKKLTVSMTRN